MIKRILVPLDDSAFATTALEYACTIAQYNDAEVTGIAVLDIPGIRKSVGPVPAGASYYAEKMRKDRQDKEFHHIKSLLNAFKKKCERSNVKYREATHQGHPSEIIIQKSMYFDLIVAGLYSRFQYAEGDRPPETIVDILDSSVTPILAVPEKFKSLDNARALLAFNGSLPAARAMQHFALLTGGNKPNFKLTILVCENDMEKAGFYIENAERYVKAHGFDKVETVISAKSINDALEQDYYDKSDVIILGLHSKKFFTDFFMGSISKFLIEKGKKPILLGQ
ncbi:universal stress protein [candidate division KSB1 bacterium]